jgi:lysophospholipase L1-like esterase
MKKRMIQRITVNVLLFFVSLAFCIILFELFFPFRYTVEYYSIQDSGKALYSREGIPLYHGNLLSELVKLPPKKKNTTRIFIIGDSFTYGYGVLKTQAYPYYLGVLLNNNTDNISYEVVNAGVPGYNMQQVYQVYLDILLFRPDIIIYGIFDNDMGWKSVIKHGIFGDKEAIYYDEIPYVFYVPNNRYFLANSKIWRSLNRIFTHMFWEKIRYVSFETEKSEKMLDNMHFISQKNNISFYAVLIPHMNDFSQPCIYEDYLYSNISILRQDFVYFNFTADVNRMTQNNCSKISILNSSDKAALSHPSPQGHRLFAELLYKFLKEKHAV